MRIATWSDREKAWKRRVNGGHATIGRMYTVSTSAGEQYYLRMLLSVVVGATCWEGLRTTGDGDGRTVHPTFKAACIALGLLHDDEEWRGAMQEAAFFRYPNQLRIMFANLLLFNNIANPRQLYALPLISSIQV